MSTSVAFTIFVLRFHFRGHKQNKLPEIAKKLMLCKNKPNNYDTIIVRNESISSLNNSLISVDSNTILKSKYLNLRNKNDAYCTREIYENLKSLKKMHKARQNERELECIKEANLVEWKKAASRLDLLFFLFSFTVVTCTPFYLFYAYLFDDTSESFKLSRCIN